MPKRVELLKLGLPKLSHVGYLANPQYGLHEPQLKEMEAAAQRLGLKFTLALVTDAAQFEKAFAGLVSKGAKAIGVQQDPLFTGQSTRIVTLAETNRLPTIYALRTFYDAGGLIS